MRLHPATTGVLAAAALAMLAAPPARAQAAAPATAESDDAIYHGRFVALMSGKGEAYAPLEAVTGATNARALRRAARPTLPVDALAAATAYAASNRSKAFLVWRDGAVEAEAYFSGTTAQTELVSKSLAKPLTAIVVGRAIALGYIKSLDQPVADFIPEWRGGPKAAIKIRHLLDMRSGLLPQNVALHEDDILNRAYLHPRHDEILIRDYPLVHVPGERFDYANAVADLVAVVIERATHERYARFVSEAVLAPIGAVGGQVWIDRPGGLAHSACCILLPAETWLRLAVLLIDDGRWKGRVLLPPGYVAEMRRTTPQNPSYGLGVYADPTYVPRRSFTAPDLPGPRVLQGEPYAAPDLYMFDGNADQVVYIVPSRRLIVMRLGDAPPKSPEWDNAVLPNLLLKALDRSDAGRGS